MENINQEESIFNINSDNDIEMISYDNKDITEEYNDEELLEDENKFSNTLELMAYEQVKLFMTDSKNFFTSSLIESVGQILSSNHIMDSEDITRLASDMSILFSRACNRIDNIESVFGNIIEKNTIDKIIIDTIDKVSKKLMSDEIPFSNYLFKSILNEVINQPEYYAELSIDKDLSNNFKNLFGTNIEINKNFISNIKNTIESKIKILDVVQSVQQYTKFISQDAIKYNNMEDFLNGFYEVLNNTSANISRAVEDDNDGITLNKVLDKSFYKTIIRTRDDHIKCGMNIFDSITNGGFERDRVYLLSAKTGGGKSTLLLNIAYGMYKIGNGMFLPEISIFNKMAESDENIQLFDDYCKANIENIKAYELHNHPNDREYANKKHILLYFTLENTEEETMKRYIGRMGLFTNIFWNLIERDEDIKKCITQEGGFSFTENNLPLNMSAKLKRRLKVLSSYIRILNKYSRTKFKVIWKQPYSINTFDLFAEIKKAERNNYIVDAIFVDYPDKLKAINADNSIVKGEQSWNEV